MSSHGYPDYQRYSVWFGTPLVAKAAQAIGAGLITEGPFESGNWSSVIVYIKPTGGNVTVTIRQTASGVLGGLVSDTVIQVGPGSTRVQSVVLLGNAVTMLIQGDTIGETVSYSLVPSNTAVNTGTVLNPTIGVQKNDVLVGTEPIIDLVDTAQLLYTVTDDGPSTRIKASLTLGQNGATTNALYRWTGAAWAPTTLTKADETHGGLLLAGDTNLYRNSAASMFTDGSFTTNGGFLRAIRALYADFVLVSFNTTDNQNRFTISSNGIHSWINTAGAIEQQLYAGVDPNSAPALLADVGNFVVNHDPGGSVGDTGLWVCVHGVAVRRVVAGAANSGGAGFRMLTVLN